MWCSTTTSGSLGGQVADELAELGELALGQTAGRLVEQDQAGARHQRPGQRDPLAHAVGQLAGPGVRGRRGADPLQRLPAPGLAQPALVAACRGSANSADQKPADARLVAPTMTFSSADSPPYKPTPCRVLATPRAGEPVRPDGVTAAAEEHLARVRPG